MEFCPECGAILLPMNKKLKCKCGYEKSLSDEVKDQYEVKGETNPKSEVIVTDNKNVALPTTTITCYKQGLQMKLQQILSDVQNVETHGGHLTNFLNIIKYKLLYYENASKDIKVSCR
jgi:DNA-directed RNA polymerase subunit M/transcription elongation factor TFIIS